MGVGVEGPTLGVAFAKEGYREVLPCLASRWRMLSHWADSVSAATTRPEGVVLSVFLLWSLKA